MADLNSIPSPTDSPEPAVYGTLISASVALVASLGLHLSADQVVALSTILTILAGFVIRHHVKPVISIDHTVQSSTVSSTPPGAAS